jgi:hypothetical protein
MTTAEKKFRKGDKQMLIKMSSEANRDVVRQLAPGQAVTALPVNQAAANASRWINENTQGRRLRRQRRMERAQQQRISGWSVRTW